MKRALIIAAVVMVLLCVGNTPEGAHLFKTLIVLGFGVWGMSWLFCQIEVITQRKDKDGNE